MAFLAITVETMDDSGEGSLRAALDSAAALTADDTLSITFDASLSGQTLFLQSQLVVDSDARIVLDGDIDGDDAPDIVIAGDSDRNGVVVAAHSRQFFVEDGVRVSIASVLFQDGVGLGDEAAGEQGGDAVAGILMVEGTLQILESGFTGAARGGNGQNGGDGDAGGVGVLKLGGEILPSQFGIGEDSFSFPGQSVGGASGETALGELRDDAEAVELVAIGASGDDEIDLLFDDAPPGLLGLSGNDRLASSAGVSLFGGKRRDSLTGSIRFDELNGGGGKDEIDGGLKGDTISGGGGKDKIVFQSGASGFSDLKIRQKGDDVQFKYEGGAIILEDADKDDFCGRDFLFA
ncbi:hypothetical protein [uncultured Albimonas sp.]|uniref:hypothetical protein n=1 Tax=uncultured Albimonas sp. TaxID=1331701 RepID=UPI0030ED162B|tara:strand:+ start:1876 stop:2922 length:1047 start_codon:yes stop_codon:yes gene_type:complete